MKRIGPVSNRALRAWLLVTGTACTFAGCAGGAPDDGATEGSELAAAAHGLTAQYYTGTSFDTLVTTRTDATVDFNWGSAAPAGTSAPADGFSVRWTGEVVPAFSQTYTFTTRTDDGVRLSVNGKTLVDNWTNHSATDNSGTIALTAGQHYAIKLEYYENKGSAVAQLSWASPSQVKQIVPSSALFTTATPPPSDRGPVSFANLAAARAALHTPTDANYVTWNPAWPVDRDLEDVFATELATNDILVLPERAQPYVIDSSEGFRSSGVQSVMGRHGNVPIISRYHGIRNARTWFGMARAHRGVLGLGPNARIVLSQSSWTQEPQIEDKGSVQADGWVSPGRTWIDTTGAQRTELVGAQEKILDAQDPNAYFGNFSLRAHDLGGVAFGGVVASHGNSTFERLDLSNGWRGFQGVPNGETGAIGTGGATYLISKCVVGTRDDAGNRVGSSPIMVNSSTGGGRIEDTDVTESRAGMLTLWNCTGKHVLSNVATRFNRGSGINLEQTQAGFELEWDGGANWSDYHGNGGKTPKPADEGAGGGMHISLYAAGGSAKITFKNVDLDNGLTPGALNIQSYGATKQKLVDIVRLDANGNALPIKVYGTIL